MSDARWGDPREYGERDRNDERPRVYDERDRNDHDPRDALMHDLDLPRGDDEEAPSLLLSPMIASAAMTFSSVSVIGNALRLRRVEL